MSEHDDKFLKQINQTLDEASDNLDAHTQSRLNQARHNALTQPRRPTWLFPLASATAVASVAVVSFSLLSTQAPTVAAPDIIEDIELLSSAEDLEFYENLDFYQWLEDEEVQS